MTSSSERYESPLATRYSSPAMQRLWSAHHKAVLWRRIWLALAEEQARLGLNIPDNALEEMRLHIDDVDLDAVAQYEQKFRHDVMAQIHAFGDIAPAARPYIHLGATSAFVTDNADLIVMREGLGIILGRLTKLLDCLKQFALTYRTMPTVAFTHFQPAQLTTVGKRAALWLYDLAQDAEILARLVSELPSRGCKGTTGTQASYLELFEGDHQKVKELDRRVAGALGFERTIPVTGQTYSRKLDFQILATLSGVAQSAAKCATDVRLLQHEGEILEPFEVDQVGSSAMPYKRNPMRSERVCALARYTISLAENPAYTAATQWLERTLDDSANRRLVLADAFLSTDATLVLLNNICSGFEVKEGTIRRNVGLAMPFMATERWLMLGVTTGGDRQELHEIIRKHSLAVMAALENGAENDLLERLASDPAFSKIDTDTLTQELNPERYVGRSAEQVQEFVIEWLDPLIGKLERFRTPDEASVTV